MDNAIHLTGNLTRDPEMRFLNSGKAVASFGLAVNARKKDAAGEWVDDPKFFDVVTYDTLAENVAESLTKGVRVTLGGRLDFRQWEADDGGKRSKVEVIADSVGPDLRWATAAVTKVAKP